MMDTRIYICTHKTFFVPPVSGYIPLHVGSALHPDLGYQRDDEGEEISAKNPNYCELTGVYYIWKNVRCDIVGICHYRRYFAENGAYLSRERIEELLEDHDVILPVSGFSKYENLWEHYKDQHVIGDLEKTREVLLKKYPEYVPAFDLCMQCNLLTTGNMMIARKQVFDAYCEWLFDVLYEVEKITDLSGYDSFQARLYGYLSERLLRVYMLMHEYRVAETDFALINPDTLFEEQKEAGVIRKYTDLMLSDVITLYQRGQMQDLIEDWPDLDFEGRTPVFLPGAIDDDRKAALRAFLGEEPFFVEEPILTLPEPFQSLAKEEQTEIYRASVLYHYGGFWIGNGFEPVGTIDNDIKKRIFSTRRQKEVLIHQDLRERRWDPDFLFARPGCFLMGFLMNGLCYFRFKTKDRMPAPLTDCVLDSAFRNFEEARKLLE